MPWQQYVADVILEVDPDTGCLVYDEFGLTVPRQSGKSTFLLAKAIHRGSATKFFGPRQALVYMAQTRKDSREKFFEDFFPQVETSIFRTTTSMSKLAGAERIRMQNGSFYKIEATTEKAGHGGTLDEGHIDEAFAHIDNRSEDAIRPAMITRRNKQLGIISTAGYTDGSAYLKGKVAAGRAAVEAGLNRGLAYFEWSAPEDADPADPAVWWDCMPALGYTITEAAIRAEYDRALREGKLASFRRAYLNQWVLKASDVFEGIIDPPLWLALNVGSVKPLAPVLSVEVSLDGSRTCVGAAWLIDGKPHVEPFEDLPGTDVVARLEEHRVTYGVSTVVVDSGTQAADLVPKLKAAGLTVVEVSKGAERAAACASFFSLASSAGLSHNGDPALASALANARWKDVGEGARAFSRRKSAGSIAELYAVTLALHGLTAGGPPREFWGAMA